MAIEDRGTTPCQEGFIYLVTDARKITLNSTESR